MTDVEDSEFVASEHDQLITAVSKLDKTQHITEPTRNEPTNLNSEFNLIKRTNKLNLKKVVKVLEDTANHVQISKKLKRTQDASKILRKPLEKPQAERIKRSTGYEATKTKIGRWDPVVARSRTVDFVSFPLKQACNRLQPTGEFLSKFRLKSSLEKELEEIDPPAVLEADDEPVQDYPMSYDEMVEHRQHLAKLRAQQSYKAAKAKRQSKIKSKKFHRVLKKERLKKQLLEFEELQKTNPEEALQKLEVIEKARALERHTLRHKNTGKWAKNKLIRAKYDTEVRQQLAEQLAVSRGLTKKTQDNASTDDDADDNDVIPDINLSQDPMNPWMMQRPDKSNINAQFNFGYKKYIQNKMVNQPDDSDSNDEQDQLNEERQSESNLSILKESVSKLTQNNEKDESNNISEPLKKKQKTSATKISKLKQNKPVATSKWDVVSIPIVDANQPEKIPTEDISSAYESYECNVAGLVEKKLNKFRKNIERLEKLPKLSKKHKKQRKENEPIDNLEYLKLKNQRKRAIIDEELIETVPKGKENQTEKSFIKHLEAAQVPECTVSNIDPSRFIEVKPKYLNTALPQGENELDQLDDDEQVVPKVNIEEVFEEDDVVASFRQDKDDEINKNKLEDIDLSLPGWGQWGGKGVTAPKRRNNRFILKAPPTMPRRDENKGDIIIKEYKDPKLTIHKVSNVPFPFTSVKNYEASIRAPLGNTFIPEKAHKNLIRPSVITKAGTIIEPMDEDELLNQKNKRFKNESVIKILAKK